VLNIAPWSAPVLLSILPCLGALAAGNCCVIKPPDAAPKTSKFSFRLVWRQNVTVVEGGASVSVGLIDMAFDHIMSTGGTSTGRLVMAHAARTLTPVTLENTLTPLTPLEWNEPSHGSIHARQFISLVLPG
jgi:aldehyde dehydrogenase (NAD+)